jgi:hypothetical protein
MGTNHYVLASVVCNSGGRTVEGVDLRPLDCRDRGFKTRWELECLSVAFVVCCVGVCMFNCL